MPKYRVTDAKTGLTLELEGDSPPTDAELTELFAQHGQRTWGQSTGEFVRGGLAGAKDVGLGMLKMADPRIAMQMGTGLGTAIVEGAKTLPDITRNLWAGGDRRAATFSGLATGAKEGVGAQLGDVPTESTPRRAGRVAANLGVFALPYLPKAVRSFKAAQGAGVLEAVDNAGNLLSRAPVGKPIAAVASGDAPLTSRIPIRSPEPPIPPSPNAGGAVVPRLSKLSAEDVTRGALEKLMKERSNLSPADMPGPDRYSQIAKALKDEAGIDVGGYAGPERRAVPRLSPSPEDVSYQAMRAKLKTGAPTGSSALREALANKQKVDAARAPAKAGDLELPDAWKALQRDTPPVRSTTPIDLESTLGKVTERAPEMPRGAKVRDELYRSVLQERIPGGRVTGVTAKGEAAVRQALEEAGFDKARRSQFYREAEGARANYRRLIEDEQGAASPKLLVPIAGAGLGAAIGGATGEDDDDKLGRALLGALMGGTAGAVATNPKGAFSLANKARIEGMLSGMAPIKNVGTAVGGTLTAAGERLGTGASVTSPIKEMLRLPTNARVFADAVMNPNTTARGTGLAQAHQSNMKGPLNFFRPSRVIGGIDETANQWLKRAGATEAERDRLLLTANNNAGQALGLDNPVGRFAVPFQRTPVNVLREGVSEVNQALGGAPGRYNPSLPNVNPKARRVLTAGSPIIGAIIGEWAAEDPKTRGPIAALLLSAAGPRGLPATVGALTWAGARHGSGLARSGGLGGLAPIPEMSFDPKAMTGWPPSLLRLIKRYTDGEK